MSFANRAVPEEIPMPDPAKIEKGRSLAADALRRLSRNKMALIGLVLFLSITAFSFLGPLFVEHDYARIDLTLGPSPPSESHWFGTDTLGRDMFARVAWGGRISIMVGFLATAVSIIIGVLYGAVSGFVGGRVDAAMMRAVDILYALPFTIFVILLMTLFERDIKLLFVAIGAVEWLTMARIVRGQIMAIKRQEFVEAAVGLGVSKARIVLRHLLPNTVGPTIVYATLTVPAVMLLESLLSFLGLGVQAPMTSWGRLISDGASKMDVYPWILGFPAIFFSLTLFSLNFLGDGLRDALDPQSSKD